MRKLPQGVLSVSALFCDGMPASHRLCACVGAQGHTGDAGLVMLFWFHAVTKQAPVRFSAELCSRLPVNIVLSVAAVQAYAAGSRAA